MGLLVQENSVLPGCSNLHDHKIGSQCFAG